MLAGGGMESAFVSNTTLLTQENGMDLLSYLSGSTRKMIYPYSIV